MNLYPENYEVSVDVLFTDLNGAAIVPSAVTAKLYDGDDQLVEDLGVVAFDPTDGKATVIIPASFNVLGAGEPKAARILRVALTTTAGVISRSTTYVITGDARLVLMVNSFQTYEAAELLASDFPNLTGWAAAGEDSRYAAMITAYNRLTRIPMRFHPVADYPECETIISRFAWSSVTEEEFLAWPIDFRKALRRAQLVEASGMLENDATERRHRAGIISETVGESSIMLRGGRLEMGLDNEALRELTGFIYYNHRITRV